MKNSIHNYSICILFTEISILFKTHRQSKAIAIVHIERI